MSKQPHLVLFSVFFFAGCGAPADLAVVQDSRAAPPGDTPAPSTPAAGRPAVAPAPVAPPSAGALIEDERNTISVFDAAAPATVFVTQTQLVRDWYSMRALEVAAGSGTGFVWDKQGHIVTNYHVVDGGRSYEVTLLDGNAYPATLVGGEPRKDIAVLKIDAPAGVLFPVRMPPENQGLRVGQKTVAIGNPFGLDHTLTTGVISALGREVEGYGKVSIRDMIQTDASINPGNSGGPLLNSQGQLIGMNTMIYSPSGQSAGIGFAVPSGTIARLVPQIIAHGRPTQVGLGVDILPDQTAQRLGLKGVIVKDVAADSGAAAAGIKGLTRTQRGTRLGDVIVRIDDQPIADYDDLYNCLEAKTAGETVVVTLLRDRQEVQVQVALGAL